MLNHGGVRQQHKRIKRVITQNNKSVGYVEYDLKFLENAIRKFQLIIILCTKKVKT